MSTSNGSGLAAFMLIGTIAISIGSGILAWNWVEPKSFMGAIGFLAVWAFFSYIGHIVVGGIVAMLGGMD